jgi:hypothetical protein
MVGEPWDPIGSWSCHPERSKFPPGLTLGSSWVPPLLLPELLELLVLVLPEPVVPPVPLELPVLPPLPVLLPPLPPELLALVAPPVLSPPVPRPPEPVSRAAPEQPATGNASTSGAMNEHSLAAWSKRSWRIPGRIAWTVPARAP